MPLLQLHLHLEFLFSRHIFAWQNCKEKLPFKRAIYHFYEIQTGNVNDVQAMENFKCLFQLVKVTLEIAL